MKLSEKDCIALIDGLTPRRLQAYVRYGWILPQNRDAKLTFDDMDLARLRFIVQLHDDLDVNEEALPIILSLVDQIYGLRRELRMLACAIGAQPQNIADRILEQVRG